MSLNLTLRERLERYTVDENGCHNYTGHIKPNGYGVVWFNYGYWFAHRLSYTLNVGEIPDGLFVLHACGNRACINPEHLRVGTHKENMEDRHRHGTTATGERNGGGGKLTEEQVGHIKQALRDGCSSRSLGREYNVSKTMILHIKNGKLWREVP